MSTESILQHEQQQFDNTTNHINTDSNMSGEVDFMQNIPDAKKQRLNDFIDLEYNAKVDMTTVTPSSCGNAANTSNMMTIVDDPCWGSPTECTLQHLLQRITNGTITDDDNMNPSYTSLQLVNTRTFHINNNNNIYDNNRKNEKAVVLYESKNFIVLNKPPDLRMDGNYPATVHKLLTYWYPPQSLQQKVQELLQDGRNNKNKDHVQADMAGTMAAAIIQNNIDEQHSTNEKKSSSDLLLQLINQITNHSELVDNELRPCHQLDYATSGVLVVGRNKHAANRARMAFENRSVQKVYTAVLTGHLLSRSSCHYTKAANSLLSTSPVSSSSFVLEDIPTIAKDQLDGIMSDIEKKYRKSRSGNKEKKQKQTFQGYLPAHALYQQWQKQQQKNMSSRNVSEFKNNDQIIQNTKQHHQNQNREKQQLSTDQWDTVWKTLYNSADTESIHSCHSITDDNLSNDAVASNCNCFSLMIEQKMNWKQVKKKQWNIHFERAAEVYNQILSENIKKQQEKSNFTTTVDEGEGKSVVVNNNNNSCNKVVNTCHDHHPNDVVGIEKDDSKNCLSMGGLPLVFRVANDDDDHHQPENICIHKTKGINNSNSSSSPSKLFSFYIAAPIAEPIDSTTFAMIIHSSYASPQRCPQLLTSNSSGNNTTTTLENELLDFKPSLTKCTILQETYVNVPDKSHHHSEDHHQQRIPVTTVRLEPKTGRRHQLRVHTAMIGYPILGDQTYRRQSKNNTNSDEDNIDFVKDRYDERLCLHSYSIRIPLLDDTSSSTGNETNISDVKQVEEHDDHINIDGNYLFVSSPNPFQKDPNDDNLLSIRIF